MRQCGVYYSSTTIFVYNIYLDNIIIINYNNFTEHRGVFIRWKIMMVVDTKTRRKPEVVQY